MSEAIFRGYDRAALDFEYDNQAKVPNWAEWRAKMAADSEAVRATLPCRLDQAYGPHPRQRLDVFLPPDGPPAPVHVFIHGGYWQRNDKAGSSYVARTFVAAGYATVVINYGLSPDVTLDDVVQHCRAAIVWVYHNAASFGGDAGRISVSGHSAGGHLAAMLLATDWTALGLPANTLTSACGISGLYDLEPLPFTYVNNVMQLDAAMVQRNSPVQLPPPAQGRLLLAVGSTEGPEFHRQVTALAKAWQGPTLRCDTLDIAGADHFSIAAQLMDPASELSRAVLAHLALP